MSYKSEMERVAADRAAREEAAKKASAVPKEVTPTATKAKEGTPVEAIFKEVTPTASTATATSTATAAPTSAPTKGDGIKTVTELEVERLRKELEEAKKAASEANKKAAENAKKAAEAEKAANKKEEPEKSDKKGDVKMSEKVSEKTAKMVAPMGYAAKARALLDCMYATCAQFEQEVAELETLEQILVTSEDELGNAEHVWKYMDRNGIPCFARTMGEVLKNSPGGKPEETWAFIVRGQFLELTREQKEMFGLA